MIIIIIGIISVLIVVSLGSILWYQHYHQQKHDRCDQLSSETTMFWIKFSQLQQRLEEVKQRINCLNEH